MVRICLNQYSIYRSFLVDAEVYCAYQKSNAILVVHSEKIPTSYALAAICVSNERGDVFCVSLAMDSNGAKLYVSTNGPVPANVTVHLEKKYGKKLKELKLIVLDSASSPPPNIDSPNNTSLARSLKELEIQKIIFQYSYKIVRQRYQKREPKILKQYNEIMNHLIETGGVLQKDIELLTLTHLCLETIDIILKDETPRDLEVTRLIKSIAPLSGAWKKNLDEEESLLTHWDNLTCKFQPFISHILYYSVNLFFRCHKEQASFSTTVSREIDNSSPPYPDYIAHRMVSPTFLLP